MRLRDAAELVRLPAALTVPGDVLAGTVAAGAPLGRRGWALPAASVAFYTAGMALNDYADRDLDRVERPERPIPSGRVVPGQALGLAAALTAAGLGLAAACGGRSTLRVAVPLAATAWAYDLRLKDTAFGPAAMAAARGLDVLMGSGGSRRALAAAVLPAAALAAHTGGVTTLSRGEVHGTEPAVARAVTASTTAVALGVAAGALRRGEGRLARATSLGLATLFAGTVGRAQAAAATNPDAATVRTATGAGIRGMIPLQAALLARSGSPALAAGVLAAAPVARLASRVVSPT
ncbi:MAG TPA: UbiA family prenyltransferase [Nocardioidaceae bacterium]|nr:UbiA family prenyltransferase [Nocardioidaceae bacterium]